MTAARPPAGTGLPVGLAPPVKVARARVVTKMPRAGAAPGKLIYEPKWDGYRATGIRDNNGTTLWSRQGKDLTRYFPELVAAIVSGGPGCVIDGEAVIWTGGRLDFSALQQRLGPGPKPLTCCPPAGASVVIALHSPGVRAVPLGVVNRQAAEHLGDVAVEHAEDYVSPGFLPTGSIFMPMGGLNQLLWMATSTFRRLCLAWRL